MVGSTFNHYRVAKALGQGGMGAVYLAEDVRLKRQVALKFLPSDVASDPARLDRFEREAQVVAALNHPNIVTVHSIERDGATLFIAMEYLEGRTLADLIPKGGLPLHRLLKLATQIVDAVVAAQGRGIVHRDLKPANVMVLAGDRVKVLDFGPSRSVQANSRSHHRRLPYSGSAGGWSRVSLRLFLSSPLVSGSFVRQSPLQVHLRQRCRTTA
jgi:eukaryotic-like serine/threonine-protein kinase